MYYIFNEKKVIIVNAMRLNYKYHTFFFVENVFFLIVEWKSVE